MNPYVVRARSARFAAIMAAGILALAAALPATAQVTFASANRTVTRNGQPVRFDPAAVGLDQKLNAAVPQDIPFRDETGKAVRIGDYLGQRPVILNLIFYKCPGVCTLQLDGMAALFKSPEMALKPGSDFQVVTVSINPKETPTIAMGKKREYMELLRLPMIATGWHFLTGDEASIERLATAVGYRYAYDPRTDQFAHPAGLILLTPEGKISRYFYGTDYVPKDVRLSLVEASENRIGSLTDKIFVNCIYQYDPRSGHYGVTIIKALRIMAALTLLTLVTSIVVMSRLFTRQAIYAEQKNRPAPQEGGGLTNA